MTNSSKDPAALELGANGSKATVAWRTAAERIASARRAAQARWIKAAKAKQ